MKTAHVTKYGTISVCLYGGKFIPSDAKYGQCKNDESSGYFQATRENPVIVNGIPYSFTYHFKYGCPQDYRYHPQDGRFRYEYFSSTRLDCVDFTMGDSMTENARKKIREACQEIFDTLTETDFRDAEVASFRSYIERMKSEIHDAEESIVAMKATLRAECNRFADTFGIIQNEAM